METTTSVILALTAITTLVALTMAILAYVRSDDAATATVTLPLVLGGTTADKNFAFQAVVALTDGDYTSVTSALASGATSIFVKNGAYVEDAWNIATDTVIVGESESGVVFQMNGIQAAPSDLRLITAGNIAFTQGSAVVSGTGGEFLKLRQGDWLCSSAGSYEIASVTDNSSLTLTAPFQGPSGTPAKWFGAAMIAFELRNLTLVGQAVGSTLSLTQLSSCGLTSLNLSQIKLQLDRVVNLEATQIDSVSTGPSSAAPTALLTATNVYDARLLDSDFSDSKDRAVSILAGHRWFISQSTFNNSVSTGLELGTTSTIEISGCGFVRNNGNGLSVASTCSDVRVQNCVSRDNGASGMLIAASATDRLQAGATVSSCQLGNNGGTNGVTGQLVLQGNNLSVTNCTIVTKMTGLSNGLALINCAQARITNNSIVGGGTGTNSACIFTSGSVNCNVSNNILNGLTTTPYGINFSDFATATTQHHMVAGNIIVNCLTNPINPASSTANIYQSTIQTSAA